MTIKILKISGDSLNPCYKNGDFVISCKTPIFLDKIYPGDIVVFNHHEFGIMIKKVMHLNKKGTEIFVMGTTDNSIDSRQFGFISPREIIGKVIFHIRKPINKD